MRAEYAACTIGVTSPIDACIVHLLKYAMRSRTGEFRNSQNCDFVAVPFSMLSDSVRSELSEQCIVIDEDIIRRSERLVSLGVIEKVAGASDSLRSIVHTVISEIVATEPGYSVASSQLGCVFISASKDHCKSNWC